MYKITIEKIDKNVPFKNKEYKKIGVDADGEDDFDYVYFDDTRTETETVYEQIVEDLTMQDVIKVINGVK